MKRYLLVVLLFLLYPITRSFAQGTWTAIANFPDTVENSVGLSIGTKGYVGLGNNANGNKKDWWEYNPVSNTWSQKADFGGTARYKATGFGTGTKAYVGLGFPNLKDWWEYNQVTNSWLQKTDYPGGGGYTTVSFAILGKGYVGTGATLFPFETVYNDFWEYNPVGDTWTQKADFGGVKRRHAMGFSIGCKGYLGCGWDQSAFSFYKDFWEYIPQTNTWTQKADFPFTTEGGAGFSIGNKGYIGLGEGPSLHNEFNEYNPATNSWASIPNFPGIARNRVAAFVIDSAAFVGTGGANNGTSDFYKYSPNNFGPVGVCCIMILSDTSTKETCGNANGTGTITPTGGSAPYTFLWSNGQTGQTATGLAAGTYIVTVTDNGSCSDTISVFVDSVSAPVASIAGTTTVCTGGSAILTASGGTSYLWSTSETTSSITVSPSSTTIYIVTVTNTCGSDTALITVNVGGSSLSVAMNSTIASCGQCNGTATAVATGGSSSYTYLWGNGQSTATATGLCAGNYSVTVSEGGSGSMTPFWTEDFSGGGTGWTLNTSGPGVNGAVKNFWIINALTNCGCGTGNNLHITCNQTNFVCQSSSGGAADCYYNAGPAFLGDPSTDVISISPSISTIGKSNINLKFKWVADGEAGDDFGKLRLSNDGGNTWTELPASYSGAFSCGQDSITLPSIYENISNFKIAFRWQNSANGNGSDPPFGVDDIVLSVPTGGALCSSVNSVTVSSSSSVSATALSNNTSCSANTGSALVNVSGGNTPYQYLWSSGQTTSSVTGLAAGNYFVTVTDGSGCTAIDTALVISTGGPVASASGNNTSCNGGNNGNAIATGIGGTTPYTYLWSNGQTGQTATGLTAGNYSVTINDNNNCSSSTTVNISEPVAIQFTQTIVDASCGQSDGSISISPSGGQTPYSYQWSNGQNASTCTALPAGSYYITITDGSNCTKISSIAVSNSGAPSVNISIVNPTCFGGTNGSATALASGGSSPYTFLWSNGGTQAQISNLPAQVFTVTVTDAGSCITILSDTVLNPAPLQIQFAGGDNSDTICNLGSATIIAFGGTNYQWSTGQTGSSITVTPLKDSLFFVTATDAAGCSGTDSFLVVVNSVSISAICSGTNILLTVSPGLNYLWNTGQTTQSISVSPDSATKFSVTVTSSCGQMKDTIIVAPPVNAVVSNDTTIEYGSTIQISASGGVSYLWNTGDTTKKITVSPSENTTYQVTITDAGGCNDTASIAIFIDDSRYTISVPNIFSPNNDSKNDFVKVHGFGVKEFKLVIYDRWGQRVFEDQGALLKAGSGGLPWDGTLDGKTLNSAVFVYSLDAVFIDKTEFHEKGNITLVR